MNNLFRIGLLMTLIGLAGMLSSCSSAPAAAVRRPIYTQSQFKSRLEYLRFCDHYHLMTDRCE